VGHSYVFLLKYESLIRARAAGWHLGTEEPAGLREPGEIARAQPAAVE
jgi:hypothetical protein